MIEAPEETFVDPDIDEVLLAELARGDAMISTIVPIMRHLIVNDDSSVFSEEIVARTRGMLADLARQLLVAEAIETGSGDPDSLDTERCDRLVALLASAPGLLAHVHALALEWQFAERLQARLSVDPVLSPLLQALVASTDPATSASAMKLLSVQARFAQEQRRMQLPLGELPADMLHAALVAWRADAASDDGAAARAEQKLCEQFDEGHSRLGLMTRLVMAMGGGARVALAVDHAGVALFLTALALASGQDRALTVLTTNEGQLARLALALSASGLKPQGVEEQFATLHPEISLPKGFDQMSPDRAAALLAQGAGYPG